MGHFTSNGVTDCALDGALRLLHAKDLMLCEKMLDNGAELFWLALTENLPCFLATPFFVAPTITLLCVAEHTEAFLSQLDVGEPYTVTTNLDRDGPMPALKMQVVFPLSITERVLSSNLGDPARVLVAEPFFVNPYSHG